MKYPQNKREETQMFQARAEAKAARRFDPADAVLYALIGLDCALSAADAVARNVFLWRERRRKR